MTKSLKKYVQRRIRRAYCKCVHDIVAHALAMHQAWNRIQSEKMKIGHKI